MRGYHDVGLSLILHGADVNAKDMSQVTPLRHAAYRGTLQQPLPSQSPSLPFHPPLSPSTPGYPPELRSPRRGSNPRLHHCRMAHSHRLSPRHPSCTITGEDAIVRLLLQYGADPTIVDAAGGQPVEVACFLRNKTRRRTVEALLRDGHRGHLCKKLRQVRPFLRKKSLPGRAGMESPPQVTFP
jgi:ankyrin repeat protein